MKSLRYYNYYIETKISKLETILLYEEKKNPGISVAVCEI